MVGLHGQNRTTYKQYASYELENLVYNNYKQGIDYITSLNS